MSGVVQVYRCSLCCVVLLQYGPAYAGRVQDGTGMLAAAAAIDLLSPGSLAASRRQRHSAQQALAPTPAPTSAAGVAAGDEAATAGVAAGGEAARVEQGQAGEQDAAQQDALLAAAVAEQQQARSNAVAAAQAAAAEAEAAAAEAEAAAHAAAANVLGGEADQGVAVPVPGSAGQQGQQQEKEEGGGMDVDGGAQQPSWSTPHTSPLALLL